MQWNDRGEMPEWVLPGRLVKVQTHAWDGDGNLMLQGTIASMNHGLLYLRQQRTIHDEPSGRVRTEERLVAIPWQSVVYISEPAWRTIDPLVTAPLHSSVTSRSLNLNRSDL